MIIGLLTVEFHLPSCSSLKEKRGRLGGMKDKFGRIANLAVSETAFHDNHNSAQWSFVGIASDRKKLDQLFAGIETYVATQVDAVISRQERQLL